MTAVRNSAPPPAAFARCSPRSTTVSRGSITIEAWPGRTRQAASSHRRREPSARRCHDLPARKPAASELGLAEPTAGIDAFIDVFIKRALERRETTAPPPQERGNVLELLNGSFRQSLREALARSVVQPGLRWYAA